MCQAVGLMASLINGTLHQNSFVRNQTFSCLNMYHPDFSFRGHACMVGHTDNQVYGLGRESSLHRIETYCPCYLWNEETRCEEDIVFGVE